MIDDTNDTNKTFIVTAKFKMSGILPDMVTSEHVESNIRSTITEAISNVDLSSEYYDMDEDIEWEIFLEGDVKVDTKEFAVNICEEPFCEHCGQRFTDFGIEISDDGTSWCTDCFLSGDNDGVFSKEELEELYKKEKKLRMEYYVKKLKEIEDDENQKKTI